MIALLLGHTKREEKMLLKRQGMCGPEARKHSRKHRIRSQSVSFLNEDM